jgi:hypothetical protein
MTWVLVTKSSGSNGLSMDVAWSRVASRWLCLSPIAVINATSADIDRPLFAEATPRQSKVIWPSPASGARTPKIGCHSVASQAGRTRSRPSRLSSESVVSPLLQLRGAPVCRETGDNATVSRSGENQTRWFRRRLEGGIRTLSSFSSHSAAGPLTSTQAVFTQAPSLASAQISMRPGSPQAYTVSGACASANLALSARSVIMSGSGPSSGSSART